MKYQRTSETCFQSDMDYEDLTRRTASDKILRDKSFNIAKYRKYDGYRRAVPSKFCKFFDRKTSGSGIKNKNISNRELAEDLHKPVIRKLKKINVIPLFTKEDLRLMAEISTVNRAITRN